MPDTPTVPDSAGQTPETPAPSAQQDGQAKKTVETQEDLPEKYKGKTAGEIAKWHSELERKLGEQSKSVAEAKETRVQLAQWEALGKVLESNPALYKQVEDEINRRKSPGDTRQETRDDTRIATESILISNFEKQYSIDTLSPEAKKDLNQKIANELVEIVDPGGKKTPKQIIESIPLDRLPKYLEKAYRLATVGDEKERGRLQALSEARQNSEAAFGSMASSSPAGNQAKLTEEEKTVAKRMGITEEKYLKSKQTLAQ